MRTDRFFLFTFCGRSVSFGVDDSAAGTYFKAGAAFLTKEGIYVETDLDFTCNGIFSALFGACTTSNALFADTVRHREESPLRISGREAPVYELDQ